MKRGCLIGIGILVLLLVLFGGTAVGKYNGLVAGEENVTAKWSEIDNMYSRRADLIPMLVKTVEGAADYEKSTLQAVVDARASVGRVQLPGAGGMPTDPAAIEAYMSAQQGLSGALGRLFAVSENYPTLRASENFLSLQDQIEGSENRITVARSDFINAVKTYNTSLRSFPGNLLAGLFGFEKAAVLPADEGNREAPVIEFGGDG